MLLLFVYVGKNNRFNCATVSRNRKYATFQNWLQGMQFRRIDSHLEQIKYFELDLGLKDLKSIVLPWLVALRCVSCFWYLKCQVICFSLFLPGKFSWKETKFKAVKVLFTTRKFLEIEIKKENPFSSTD